MAKMQTPWGVEQHRKEAADGIVFISTASHGGFHLNAERQAALAALFPSFRPYAGAPWYEEDEDWAVVVLAFPRAFSVEEIVSAVEHVPSEIRLHQQPSHWNDVALWLESTHPTAVRVRGRAAEWQREHADDWRRGCMSSGGDGWDVQLRRISDGVSRAVHMAAYPDKVIYTTAEVEAMA